MKKRGNCIYVVDLIERIRRRYKNNPDFGEETIIGYFFAKEDALDCLQNIEEDYMGKYRYAIIEKVCPGSFNEADKDNRWFYKYDNEVHTFKPIKEPSYINNIIGLVIG